MSQFTGFSEEDLKRIKSGETGDSKNADIKRMKTATVKTPPVYKYKTAISQRQDSDDAIDSMDFEKCKLSLKTPPSPKEIVMLKEENLTNGAKIEEQENNSSETSENSNNVTNNNKNTPDIVRGVDNYSENDEMSHNAKLVHLHMQQKLIEEQNKKRKEMLAKVLANRTKQTEEEVMKLEKVKKELQILDGQFTKDVSVLRKKIDQSCLSYANAEKHYLRIEKEFLQAKIQLQKEKEKKELLTEHLCALITHNETRKAQKLEKLMLELAEKKEEELPTPDNNVAVNVVIDGVEESTGKMVEFSTNKS